MGDYYTQPKTQKERIFELLRRRGKQGATNRELNNIAFRYGAVIFDLRKDGYDIQTVQIRKGFFKFILRLED